MVGTSGNGFEPLKQVVRDSILTLACGEILVEGNQTFDVVMYPEGLVSTVTCGGYPKKIILLSIN